MNSYSEFVGKTGLEVRNVLCLTEFFNIVNRKVLCVFYPLPMNLFLSDRYCLNSIYILYFMSEKRTVPKDCPNEIVFKNYFIFRLPQLLTDILKNKTIQPQVMRLDRKNIILKISETHFDICLFCFVCFAFCYVSKWCSNEDCAVVIYHSPDECCTLEGISEISAEESCET